MSYGSMISIAWYSICLYMMIMMLNKQPWAISGVSVHASIVDDAK